ncbi:hypothetical protein [Saccharothrix variisporea]|uniref:Uncharacterized protein n=1 Tax=Saccharothrix variisporea TaxID=543527 RepID=A0A495XD84_9PSEU|nr:hypothetical protein [Saccharothrix variisporea]RKT69498.1 hypothetical protein DFJ66_2728 [Saccharothrix variisporea]
MSDPAHDLTPFERELLADPGHSRGYTPRDGVPEPVVAPKDPAGASSTAETPEPDQEPT